MDITHLGLEFYKENNQIMIKNINFNEIFPQDENRNNFLEDIEQTIEILNKREYPDHALALKNFINIAKTL